MMMVANRVAVLVAGLTASALVGCGNADKDTAEDNLALWQAKGPKSYVYVIQTSCYCANRDPVRVVVTDDVVTSSINTKSGTTESAQTMTDLLKDVVRQAGADYDEFKASYDPTLGFLKALDIERDAHTTDDESSTRVTCLAPGVGDDVCPAP
jgi:Family of unknown function (DUF6174)